MSRKAIILLIMEIAKEGVKMERLEEERMEMCRERRGHRELERGKWLLGREWKGRG